jgi:hypothetical protein
MLNIRGEIAHLKAPPTLGRSSTPSSPSKDASTNGEQEGQTLEERRYPLREWRPLGEWWKDHILPQQDVERANVACLDDPLNLCDAMHSEDASKWEAAMQEEYASLLTKALAKEWHQNLTRSMGLGVLDYLQSGSVEDYDLDAT